MQNELPNQLTLIIITSVIPESEPLLQRNDYLPNLT